MNGSAVLHCGAVQCFGGELDRSTAQFDRLAAIRFDPRRFIADGGELGGQLFGVVIVGVLVNRFGGVQREKDEPGGRHADDILGGLQMVRVGRPRFVVAADREGVDRGLHHFFRRAGSAGQFTNRLLGEDSPDAVPRFAERRQMTGSRQPESIAKSKTRRKAQGLGQNGARSALYSRHARRLVPTADLIGTWRNVAQRHGRITFNMS